MELIAEKSPLIILQVQFAMLSGSFTRFKQIKLLLTILSLAKNIAGIVKFFRQHDNELHGDSTLAETNRKYYVVAGEM